MYTVNTGSRDPWPEKRVTSPAQRGARKMGSEAPKRKLKWPLLPWGRKYPPPPPPVRTSH